MKKPVVALASASLLLVLCLSLWPGRNPSPAIPETPVPAPSAPPSPSVAPPSAAPLPPAVQASAPAVELVVPVEAATPSPTLHAAALDAMHEAVISYDPTNLPVIARYLDHADLILRTAALESMLQMGDKAAAPLLRAAAKKTASPQEAIAMLQAADYLELPSGTGLLRKKKPGANAPSATPTPAHRYGRETGLPGTAPSPAATSTSGSSPNP